MSAHFLVCCSAPDEAQRHISQQLPVEPVQLQPQLPQPTRQTPEPTRQPATYTPFQANAQPLPETKRKLPHLHASHHISQISLTTLSKLLECASHTMHNHGMQIGAAAAAAAAAAPCRGTSRFHVCRRCLAFVDCIFLQRKEWAG